MRRRHLCACDRTVLRKGVLPGDAVYRKQVVVHRVPIEADKLTAKRANEAQVGAFFCVHFVLMLLEHVLLKLPWR
jgi:hypothetical protein